MLRERPILFSGPMVRAILADRKTQTRRVIRGGPDFHARARLLRLDELDTGGPPPFGAWFGDSIPDDPVPLHVTCPCGQPGDRLWVPRWASRIALEVTGVRVERVQDISAEDAVAEGITVPRSNVICACEGPAEPPFDHQPHCAWRDPDVDPDSVFGAPLAREVVEFAILWNTINAARGCGWSKNPWVWVVDFRRLTP